MNEPRCYVVSLNHGDCHLFTDEVRFDVMIEVFAAKKVFESRLCHVWIYGNQNQVIFVKFYGDHYGI